MGFAPTPEQEQAINIIDRDLIVLAGAGSGKTKVLVERYINLVQQGVPFNQILAITFTRKAALEMKDRIRQTLPFTEQAHISTIDSFCQRVVADHPRQAQIDPHFRMFEEWESKALLNTIVREVLAKALKQGEEGVTGLREDYRQLKQLVAYLVEIYQEMITKGAEEFKFDASTDQIATLDRQVVVLQQELCYQLTEWLPWIKQQKLSPSKQRVVEQVEVLWPQNNQDFIDLDPESKQEMLEELRSLFGGNWAVELREKTKALQQLCIDLRQNLVDQQGIYELTQISKLLERIHENYVSRKLAQGILDYDDVERIAVQLLNIPEVRASYDFKYILLDEAQDTNERQKQLIDSLTSEPQVKLFVVGDPKQSIYRFRGAEVDVFLEAREKIINTKGKHIFLKDNFRSRPEVVHFANHVFHRLMANDKIDYAASTPFRESSGQPAVELLVTPRAERALGEARNEEATRIAAYIRELVDREGHSYADITILFRSMTNVKLYEEALQLAKIPFVNLSGRGFYEKNEIQDILYFIRWLLDAEDLVSKMAVLRSPFFGVSDQGLFWYQSGQLDKLNEEDQHRLTQAYQLYPILQKALVVKPAPYFIEEMVSSTTTGFRANTYGLQMGEQRLANINKFVDTSWQLWSQGYVHIEEQLAYIGEAIEQAGREGEARLDSETANVVTLMTIHGSKGLEFPVVILADCSRENRYRSQRLLYHKQEGLALKDTTHYEKLKELEALEEVSEEKRLLYVAVTRARERLILSGIGTMEELELNNPTKLNSWWQWIWATLVDEEVDFYKVIDFNMPAADQQALTEASVTSEPNLKTTVAQLPTSYGLANFSVTSLMIYAQCPRRYYYRYILRVPELQQNKQVKRVSSQLGPLERGNIVHRVCEHLREGQDLLKLLEWAVSMEGLTLNKAEQQELLAIINRYVNSSYYQEAKVRQVNHEVEFTVPLDEHFLITGAVDQVLHETNGITIMDLKTNYITPEQVDEVAASYYWQLRVYAWAINKLTKKPITKTLLYFLFPDVIHTDLNAHSLVNETEVWLTETCHHIQQGEALGIKAFPIKNDCTYCGYNCQQLEKSQQNFVDLLAGLGKLS